MSIMQIFQNMQELANQANEQRYQDILGVIGQTQESVRGTYDEIGGLLANLGESSRENIQRQEERGKAQSYQSLINRGLGGSTIKDAMERRIGEQADIAEGQLDESLRAQQAGVLQQLAGAEERMGSFLAQMMEARTDQGPPADLYSSLLQQQAAAGGGGRGGGAIVNNRPAVSLGQMFQERMFGGSGLSGGVPMGVGSASFGRGGSTFSNPSGAAGAMFGGPRMPEGSTTYLGGGGTVEYSPSGAEPAETAVPAGESQAGGGGGGEAMQINWDAMGYRIFLPQLESMYGRDLKQEAQDAGYQPIAMGYWGKR